MKRTSYRTKRTIVDLAGEDLEKLDSLAEADSVSRASVLREAVAEYVLRRGKSPGALKPLAGFGALKGAYGDGQIYQVDIRNEWE